MTATIVQLDPYTATAEALAAAYELRLTCHREGAADKPMKTYAEWVSMNRLIPSHRRRWHWATPGGYANLVWLTGSDSASVELCVAPPSRRQGIGGALLGVVRDQARRVSCRALIGSYATPAGAAFTGACGAKGGNAQHRSVLTMPPKQSMEAVAGYWLRSWTDHTPDDLLESYAAARNAICDAPHSEGAADERWTPQMVREFEAVVAQRGRQRGSQLPWT